MAASVLAVFSEVPFETKPAGEGVVRAVNVEASKAHQVEVPTTTVEDPGKRMTLCSNSQRFS